MAKDDTMYVGANGAGRIKTFALIVDELRLLSIDYSAYLGEKSASLVSSTWESDSSGTASVANPTISGGVASAEVTAASIGSSMVKVSTTLDTGEILVRKFRASVSDPFTGSTTDYP